MSLHSGAEAQAPFASTAPPWPTLRLFPAPPDPRLHHRGVPPQTAHSFLLAAPSSVAEPESLGRRVTMVTNEVPGISSLRGLGELSNRAGRRVGGGCARRTPRCPRAPTPPLEVVAESLAPGRPAGPLAVPVRHQGLGRPLEAAFLL